LFPDPSENVKALGGHAPEPPTAPPTVVVTRLDERGEQTGTLLSGSSEGSVNPVIEKTRCNPGQFYAVLSEDFVHIKFCHLN